MHFADIRNRNGRLFILGVDGSAENASHAVNDFRKLCGIETYSPADNISELIARTNDERRGTVFSSWLKTSRLKENDAVLVLSGDGGNKEKNVSVNLIQALDYAKECNAKIYGIVSRDGGYTAKMADEFIIIRLLIINILLHMRKPLKPSFGTVWYRTLNYRFKQLSGNQFKTLCFS